MYKTLISLIFSFFLLFSSFLSASALRDQTLVTVHGILGASYNMYYLVRPVEEELIDVQHWDYPSRDKSIVDHAESLVENLQRIAQEKPGQPINFLVHSMGGLILRAAINHPDCPIEAKYGIAVLIATPNRGASWGRLISQFSLVKYFARNYAGNELLTEINFDHLGEFPDTMKVLVIVGNFSLNFLLAGENDGTVLVEETYLTTPHTHIIVKFGHKSILLSKKVAHLIKDFFIENCN